MEEPVCFAEFKGCAPRPVDGASDDGLHLLRQFRETLYGLTERDVVVVNDVSAMHSTSADGLDVLRDPCDSRMEQVADEIDRFFNPLEAVEDLASFRSRKGQPRVVEEPRWSVEAARGAGHTNYVVARHDGNAMLVGTERRRVNVGTEDNEFDASATRVVTVTVRSLGSGIWELIRNACYAVVLFLGAICDNGAPLTPRVKPSNVWKFVHADLPVCAE